MPTRTAFVSPADSEARDLARSLLKRAHHAALAVIEPTTGFPGISRIALALDDDGTPLTLISDIAAHAAALRAQPEAAILVGEPGAKGDPLTHPRLMMGITAHFVSREDQNYRALRNLYLAQRPKSKLYIDFSDFSLVRLLPRTVLLNGGFGRAWQLSPQDISSD